MSSLGIVSLGTGKSITYIMAGYMRRVAKLVLLACKLQHTVCRLPATIYTKRSITDLPESPEAALTDLLKGVPASSTALR